MIFVFDILLIGLVIGTIGSIIGAGNGWKSDGALSTRFGYVTPAHRQF